MNALLWECTALVLSREAFFARKADQLRFILTPVGSLGIMPDWWRMRRESYLPSEMQQQTRWSRLSGQTPLRVHSAAVPLIFIALVPETWHDLVHIKHELSSFENDIADISLLRSVRALCCFADQVRRSICRQSDWSIYSMCCEWQEVRPSESWCRQIPCSQGKCSGWEVWPEWLPGPPHPSLRQHLLNNPSEDLVDRVIS